MKRLSSTAGSLAASLFVAAAAKADVTISTHATSHMSCVGIVCTPTAAKAVLNVGQLQTMLASGNVTVKATAAAPNIRIAAPLSWSSLNNLGLDAYDGVYVTRPVSITSGGGLVIVTNDGGSHSASFVISAAGNVHFWDLNGALSINGHNYALVNDITTLAASISMASSGNFALAADYNAGPDGEYALSPIPAFSGHFEGLGHTISNVTIRGANKAMGLFLDNSGEIENFNIRSMNIHSTGSRGSAGGIAAINDGTLRNVHVLSGKISATATDALGGGLAGLNNGLITASSSNNLPQNGTGCIGGLVGRNTGTIDDAWAAGKAFAKQAGGIACANSGTITNVYSLVFVGGRFATPYPGGLVGDGQAGGSIQTSYAAGQITAASNFGGVAGSNASSMSNVYWDIDYTGASPTFGCGSGNCTGATGLTHEEMLAALPTGFDPSVWAQNPDINGGWPYLIDNPPR
ncbi:MAG: hypothetical protein JOZ72_05390 [Alphaproteobacteria bacterium]|nr:hypothetical protein [Alphaproteobacteria bacterium]